MSWAALPAQAQYLIFRHLEHVDGRLSHAAVVSKQWQRLAETRLFRSMSLTQHDLPAFTPMLYPRRHLIKSIWFRIELQDYDCRLCRDHVSPPEPQVPLEYLRLLFQALSYWEPGIILSLDISIYSPSDRQHVLKYVTFEPDLDVVAPLDPRQLNQTIARREANRAHVDRHRFHVNGHQKDVCESISKIFSPVDWFGNRRSAYTEKHKIMSFLPNVPAVKVLQLRLQNRRQWWPTTVQAIIYHLPNLLKLHFEPWRQWDDSDQMYFDQAYDELFRAVDEMKLSEIVVFENYNRQYPRWIRPWYECSTTRYAHPNVTRAIWKASQFASLVCASFIADARFFFNFTPTETEKPVWPNLQKLVLTTRLFAPEERDLYAIDSLFIQASIALEVMPNLRELQLWNGDERVAAVFHYSRRRLGCFITWKSTWPFQLSPSVLASWRRAAGGHCGQEPMIRHDLLDARQVNSHADAFILLDILPVALRPPSLEQIRVESMAHRANHEFWSSPVPLRQNTDWRNQGGPRVGPPAQDRT